MNKRALRRGIGKTYRVNPAPKYRKDYVEASCEFTLIGYEDKFLTLEHGATKAKGHLYFDAIRDFREPDHLMLNGQIWIEESNFDLQPYPDPRVIQSMLKASGFGIYQLLPQPVLQKLDQLIKQNSNIQAEIMPIRLPPPDEPPFALQYFSKRLILVGSLKEIFAGVSWLYIKGGMGMGKTFVSRLIAEGHVHGRVTWISFRGEQSSVEIINHLDMHLLRIASTPDSADLVRAFIKGELSFRDLAKHAVSYLGPGGLLVIDEVPDLLKNPVLAQRMLDLCLALKDVGAKLLTTAQRDISSEIRKHLGSDITEYLIPPMTQSEISEILVAAGAPPILTSAAYLNLFHVSSRGHPILVSATISFLRHKRWVINQDQLNSILTGEQTGDIKAEASRKIFQLLPNENTRQLLYRLSLIGTSFDNSLAGAIAEVDPPIPLPAELIPELAGAWVNKLAEDRFEVSPLLSDSGKVLDASLQQNIHRAIATYYLRKRVIDQGQAFQIILHSFAAKDWHMLTWFMMQMILKIEGKSQVEYFGLVTLFFDPVWPDDMPIALRILFRSVQIRLLTLEGKDPQKFIVDFDAMIEKADPLALPIIFSAQMHIGPANPSASPTMVAQRALKAARINTQLPLSIRKDFPEIPFESLIWMGLPKIKRHEEIRGVLRVLADMTEGERKAAFSGKKMCDAPQLFADRIWMIEFEKPIEGRDWNGVLSLIEEVHQIANLPGGNPLKAPVARAKAIVLAEHLGKPDEAMVVIEEALLDTDNNGRFLLHHMAGCIFLDHKTPKEALERYQKALAESPTAHLFLRFDALRRASEAAGRMGQWLLCSELAKRSLALLKEDEFVYEQIEMIGEMSWAEWSQGNRISALRAISKVVRRLIRAQDLESKRYREVFRKIGHALGWMVSIMRSGSPPPHTLDGEPYTMPFPGIFSRSSPRLADAPSPPLVFPLLPYQLGLFAKECSLHNFAYRKLCEAKQMAEAQGLLPFRHMIDFDLADIAVRKGQYGEALQLAISGIHLLPASKQIIDPNPAFFESKNSLDNVWSGLSKEERKDIERSLFWKTIGPAITRIFKKAGSSEEFIARITELERIFGQHKDKLADIAYWLNILREFRLAFSPLSTPETIMGQIRSLPETEQHLRPLLYLAYSRSPYENLQGSCMALAATFGSFLTTRPVSKIMIEDVCVYILRYWHQVAPSQSFALRNPQMFKREIKLLQQPTISNAAKILLLSSEATGARLQDSLRKILIEAADQSQ